MDHVIGAGVRGISKGIAVVSEAIAGEKDKPSPIHPEATRINASLDSDDDFTAREQDLDDLEPEQVQSEDDQADSMEDEETISEAFLNRNNVVSDTSFQARPLPQAVILPQRRPRDRARGFVRAYASSLGEYSGIDQRTFIDFIMKWDKAAKAAPIFDVINIACFAVGMIHDPIAIVVSTVVGHASMVAQELQIRYKSNKYLSKMNDQLFKPRGLFAMVMTYKPDLADSPVLSADTSDPNKIAFSKATDSTSKFKEILHRLRNSSGTTTSEAHLPEGAPLIYPALDAALSSDNNSTALTSQSNALSRNAALIADYLDRRAQADFAAQYPGSKLSANLPPQEKKFVNRFCDPDHPVNSGSIFGLVTGGTWDPIAAGRIRRAENKARKNNESPLTDAERHDAYMGRKVRGRITGTPSKTLPVIGKVLKRDALYLVIVNLPTEREVAEIRDSLTKAKETGKAA